MKKLLLLSALCAAFLLPLTASAKDKNYRDEDYYKKEYKQTRDDIRNVQKHYDRVRDQLKNGQTSRSMWEQFKSIGSELDRLNYQFERGNTDPRYVREQARRLDYSLTRLGQQAQGTGYRKRY